MPTRAKATYPTYPSASFAYSITKTAPSVVTSKEIRTTTTDVPAYITRYEIFDGLLRPRQTQSPEAGVDGGRLISDNEYGSRGLVIRQNGPYYAAGAAGGTLVSVTDVQKQAWSGSGRSSCSRRAIGWAHGGISERRHGRGLLS